MGCARTATSSIPGDSCPMLSARSAMARIEDIADIAERADRIGHESPGIDDVAVRAHPMEFQRIDDPVAAQTLGFTIIVCCHDRVRVSAIEKNVAAHGSEALMTCRAAAPDQD